MHCARAHLDHLCLPRRRDNDVCLRHQLLHALGRRVADADGRIALEQQQRDGHAHNVAAPDHDRALAAYRDGQPVKQLDAAQRRAWNKQRLAALHTVCMRVVGEAAR